MCINFNINLYKRNSFKVNKKYTKYLITVCYNTPEVIFHKKLNNLNNNYIIKLTSFMIPSRNRFY